MDRKMYIPLIRQRIIHLFEDLLIFLFSNFRHLFVVFIPTICYNQNILIHNYMLRLILRLVG
jgi:hypothetical protein